MVVGLTVVVVGLTVVVVVIKIVVVVVEVVLGGMVVVVVGVSPPPALLLLPFAGLLTCIPLEQEMEMRLKKVRPSNVREFIFFISLLSGCKRNAASLLETGKKES